MASIGIDVGLTGAVAVVDGNALLAVHTIPTYWEKMKTKSKSGKVRRRRKVDSVALLNLLQSLRQEHTAFCAIEKVQAFSGQGAASTFNFGETYGITKALAVAAGFNISLVTPKAWKKFIEFKTKDKAESIERVKALLGVELSDHNQADAVLIAYYADKNKGA